MSYPTTDLQAKAEAAALITRVAEHFAGATGSRNQDYGEVSGPNFQMMTMHPDPEGFASDLRRLPAAIHALQSERWRPISEAPATGEYLAGRWDDGAWTCSVLHGYAGKPFTHFQIITPPEGETP